MKKNIIIILLILSSFRFIPSGAYFGTSAVSSANIFTAVALDPPPSPTLAPSSAPTPTVVPSLPVEEIDYILISEVQISTSTSSNNDFVEFYNPSSFPYDLNGHRLVRRSATSSTDITIKSWTTQTIIQPHGYYLWATSDNTYNVAVHADTATSENIAANNSIALRLGAENTGTVIDALSWNANINSLKEGTEFMTQPGSDQGIERKAFVSSTVETMSEGGIDELKGNGYDTNNNAANFILRTISHPQNASSSTEQP